MCTVIQMIFVAIVGLTFLTVLVLFGVLTEKETPRKIPIVVTESAANTFTQALIQLPNTKGETLFDLDFVNIRLPSNIPAAVDDTGSYRVQIQRDTGTPPTAMINFDDQRVLYDATVEVHSGTEAADIDMIVRDVHGASHAGFAEYVANDTVYFCVQSTAMAAATVIRGKLVGSIESLTTKEITALLLSQLN